MDSSRYKTQLQGTAAIYAVCEQLCLRGHLPCFPGVDYGMDLILENGLRLQVKSGTLRKHPAYPLGAYAFDVRHTWKRVGRQFVSHPKDRTYLGACDFAVFYGLNERRFFVVPISVVKGAVWIPPKGATFQRMGTGRVASRIGKMGAAALIVTKYEDAWDQLDINATVEAIAQTEESVIG
jgi:hypothetical protein